MKWTVFIGTYDNPKKQKHKSYDTEAEADELIDKLTGLFPDLSITKEKEE